MSKLIDAVVAKLTGRQIPKKVRLFDVLVKNEVKPILLETLTSYEISVTFEARGHCQPNELTNILDNFVKSLKRDMYDGMMDGLLRLEQAIYNEDIEEAKSVMRDLFVEVR